MRTAIALAILAQFGFAAKGIFIKLAYRAQPGLDAVILLTLRMLASLPLFLLLAWWAKRSAGSDQVVLSKRDYWQIAGLAFIGYYLASFLDFLGLQYISAALERLILFTNPTLVVLISWAFLGKAVTRAQLAALALSYLGLMLAYWHDVKITQDMPALITGTALVFASAVAYALYLIGSADITKRISSARFTAMMMCFATGFVVAQFVALRPLTALNVAPQVWIYVFALATVSTILPIWMTAEALKRLGASQAAIYGTIGPIFTIGLGVAFLNETVSLQQLAGAALTIAGVTLMSLRKK